MFDYSWRKYLKRMATVAGRTARRSRQRKPVRPLMESLESRLLMASHIVATGQPSISFIEGSQNQVLLGTFTDSTQSLPGAYSVTIQWNGSSSTGSVSAVGNTFFVTGIHTYADETAGQPITVTIQENGGDNDLSTFTTNAVVADATLQASVATFNPGENTVFSGTVATFTDLNPTASTADFTVTITWGDGATSLGTVTGSNGSFTVTGTHTYTDDLPVPFSVLVQDDGGQSTSASATVSMTETDLVAAGPGVTLTYTEGKADVANLATFTDPGGDPATNFSALINWGDGFTQLGSITLSGGTYTVRNTHTYADEGSFTVSVQIFENGVNPAPVTTVIDQATASEADVLVPIGLPVATTEGTTFNGTVATFIDTYTGNTSSDFAAVITWGDGATSTGTVSGSSGVFSVTGSHKYTDEGLFTVTVSIADTNDTAGGFATASATTTNLAAVAEGDSLSPGAPPTITATEGAAFTGTVASFTDTNTGNNGSDFSAVITWGDGSTSSGTASVLGSTITVSGSHLYAEDGSYAVTVTLADDAPGTATASTTNTASVAENDLAVQVQSGNLHGPETTAGTTFFTTVALFQDANETSAANFNAVIQWGDSTSSTVPAGALFGNSGSFGISYFHAYADEGTYVVTVTVSENGVPGSSVTAVGTAIVAEADVLTAVGSAAAVNATEGTTFSGTLATFQNTGYPANPANEFMAIVAWGDGATSLATVSAGATVGFYVVSGSHLYADETKGTYTVTLQEHDLGVNAQATASVAVAGTATVAEGDVLSITSVGGSVPEVGPATPATVATFTDSYTGNTASDFTAVLTWSDGTSSTGTIVGSNGSFAVLSNHGNDEGTLGVTVTITEHDAGTNAQATATASRTGTVTSSENDVLTVQPAMLTTTEGQLFTGTVATVTNTNLSNTGSDFTALILWGDNTISSGTVSGTNGAYTVTGTHIYFDEGIYSPTVFVNDDAPGTATANDLAAPGTATVLEGDVLVSVPVTIATTPEGTALNNTVVATFQNTGFPSNPASDFTAVINWGDNTTSVGMVVGAGGGKYNVLGSHNYVGEGNFTVTTTITDDQAQSFQGVNVVAVTEGDLTAQGTPIAASEGQTFSGTVATFSDPGTDPATTYTAVVVWGDGGVSTGTVSGSNGSYSVSGSHKYAEEGSYTATVTITETGVANGTATATTTATVAENDLALSGTTVTATEGTTFSGTVATFTDTGSPDPASAYTAVVTWGDGGVSTGIVSGSGGSFTVSGSHKYAEDGSYTATVTITETGIVNGTTVTTAAVSVAENDLSASGVATLSATEGTTFSGTVATFTDTGSPDAASTYTVVINWGDGLTSTGTVSGSGGSFTVSGSHKYAEDGSYTATVSITETGIVNGTATAASAVTVAEGDLTPHGSTFTTTAGTATTTTVATFTDTGSPDPASAFTATVNWGDGQTSTGTVTGAAGAFSVQGTHTYAVHGNYPVTVSINETGIVNGMATASSMASVATALVDVTNNFTVFRGGQLARPPLPPTSNNTWSQIDTFKNTGNTPLTGPFEIVLQNRVNGTVTNADGMTPGGDPYYLVNPGTLLPGQSMAITILFKKPLVQPLFTYDAKVFQVVP